MGERLVNSREIIHKPDEADIPDLLEEEAQKIIKEQIQTPEFKEFLDSVDFSLLRELYLRIATHCGISSDFLNFLGRERIIEGGIGNNGRYFPRENLIRVPNPANPDISSLQYRYSFETNNPKNLSIQSLLDLIMKFSIETYGSIRFEMLHTLIHEEGHAVSRQILLFLKRKIKNSEVHSSKETVAEQSGVCSSFAYLPEELESFPSDFRDFIKNGEMDRKYTGFLALNEGITEKLSREILLEYLKANGNSGDSAAVLVQSIDSNNPQLPYSREVFIVDAIVDRIASKSGVSKQTVWQSLIRAYFSGESFNNQEIEELFNDTFGHDFLRELSQLMPGYYKEYKKQSEIFFKKYNLFVV